MPIRRVVDRNSKETISQYSGNAAPGELVVDLSTLNLYVGSLTGNLVPVSGGGGNAALPNRGVQFNDDGLFAADANFTYDSTVGRLSVPGIVASDITTSNVDANLITSANVTANIISANSIVGNISLTGDIEFTGKVDLGNVGNVFIRGGSNGQVLTTDGTGNLRWTPGGGGTTVTTTPAIYFTAPATGNNQQFSNSFLSEYNSNSDITLFWNGALLENGFYTLSGNTITITTPIQIGDSIAISARSAANTVIPAIPAITFVASSTGTGQQFSNAYLTSYTSNLDMTVFKNGVLLDQDEYTLSGDTLTVLTNLNDGSEVTVIRQFAAQVISAGTATGANNSLQYNNAGAFTGANGLLWDSGSSTLQAQNINIVGTLGVDSVSSSLVPGANVAYDLGSVARRWRDLYLSGNTITIGNATISSNGTQIVIPDLEVSNTTTLSGIETGNILANYIIVNWDIDANVVTGNFIYGDGSNLSNVNALTAGTITNNAQPNITSVGALTSLTVTGESNLGEVGNVTLLGGNAGEYLQTDGSGNLIWAPVTGGLPLANGTSNVDIPSANGDVTISASGVANVLVVTSTGANITGTTNVTANFTAGNIVSAGSIRSNSGNFMAAATARFAPSSATVNIGEAATQVWLGGDISGVYANGNVEFYGNFRVPGNVDSSLIPASNITYDLGNATNRWRDLYLSGNTIYIGETTITSNGNSLIMPPVQSVTFDSPANMYIGGGNNGQFLRTDGAGNLTWATATGSGTPGGANTQVQFNNDGDFAGSSSFTFNNTTNTATVTNLSAGNVNVSIVNIQNAGVIFGASGNATVIRGANGNSVILETVNSAGTSYGANITVKSTGIDFYDGVSNVTLSNGGVISGVTELSVSNLVSTSSISAPLIVSQSNSNITLTPNGTGVVDVSNVHVSNVADPVNNQDAATKAYVDTYVQGLSTKQSVTVATTDTLDVETSGTVTYDNGVAGVGATLITTGSFSNIDGVNVQTVGTRILVKNESNAVWNGIYTYTNATAITRATDFDTTAEASAGSFTFVTAGTIYTGSGWVQTSNIAAIGDAGNNIIWTQFSSAGQYSVGTGLTLTGSQFSISNTAVTAGSYGNSESIATFTVNQQGQITSAANVAFTANATTLAGTELNSNIVTSNLTQVGTLNTLSVSGNASMGNLTVGVVDRTAYKSGEVIRTLAFQRTGFNVTSNVAITSTTPATLGYYLFTPTVAGSKVIIEYDAVYLMSPISPAGADSYGSRIEIDGTAIQTKITSYPDSGGGRTNALFPIRAVWTTANTNQSNIVIESYRITADDTLIVRNDSVCPATLVITEIAP